MGKNDLAFITLTFETDIESKGFFNEVTLGELSDETKKNILNVIQEEFIINYNNTGEIVALTKKEDI